MLDKSFLSPVYRAVSRQGHPQTPRIVHEPFQPWPQLLELSIGPLKPPGRTEYAAWSRGPSVGFGPAIPHEKSPKCGTSLPASSKELHSCSSTARQPTGTVPTLVDSFRTNPRRPLHDPTGRRSLRRSRVHPDRNQLPTSRNNRDPMAHPTSTTLRFLHMPEWDSLRLTLLRTCRLKRRNTN